MRSLTAVWYMLVRLRDKAVGNPRRAELELYDTHMQNAMRRYKKYWIRRALLPIAARGVCHTTHTTFAMEAPAVPGERRFGVVGGFAGRRRETSVGDELTCRHNA